MRRWPVLLPVVVFVVLVGFFGWRLILMQKGDTPNLIPSVMINKPAPSFDLPALLLDKPGLKSDDLKGQVTLVNFFASWCIPCRVEHPLLSQLGSHVKLVGIVYKDKPEAARGFLDTLGDPYKAIAQDRDGRVGIDFGVYGVPESYLIDKEGRIRYKQVGPFTPEDINGKLIPMLAELNK
jgi:DsbE subfamily thiol:disulfide oxidoreductase